MRGLCDGDAGTRTLTDFRDLAASATDDAANHVGRDADVLSLDVLVVFGSNGCRSAGGRFTAGVGGRGVAEVGTVASAVVGRAATGRVRLTVASGSTSSTTGDSDSRVVENGAVAALFVVDQALADLPDSLLDAIRRALNFNDTLGGLGKHLLLGDHANSGSILDLLDLEALATNDGAHLVVGDEETDS